MSCGGEKAMKKFLLIGTCIFFWFCTACSSEGELSISPKPGTDEWNKLSHEEKITAYGQLSEEKLEKVSTEKLQKLILSCPFLEETYYYMSSEQDPNGLYATSSFAVGLSLLAEEVPLFNIAVEKNIFEDSISEMTELFSEDTINTEEEKRGFVEQYQMWWQDTEGKTLVAEILDPYRKIMDCEWKRDAKTGRYEYPINAKSEEWTLLTESGKRAVCKIPQAVLDDITDDELVDLVLKYPLLVETVTEDEFFRGFEKVSEYFEPLKIMHEKRLLQKYTKEELEDKLEQSPKIAITFVENYLKTYGD